MLVEMEERLVARFEDEEDEDAGWTTDPDESWEDDEVDGEDDEWGDDLDDDDLDEDDDGWSDDDEL